MKTGREMNDDLYSEHDELEPGQPDVLSEELSDEELYAVLADYRRRQARQHMIGPGISFIIHVVGLLLLSFLIIAKERPQEVVVEITTEELEIKEPEKEIEQEIEDVKEIMEDVMEQAPATPTPELEAPVTDLAMEDVSDEAPETEDMDVPDMQEVLDVKINPTPLKIAGILGGRRSAGRTGGGAPGAANAAVDSSLAWLAKMQDADGRWPFSGHPNAVQAACTLAFLGRGHTMTSGKYSHVVRKSLENFMGRIPRDGGLGNHGHATPFVAMAICDAFAMEPDNSALADAARKNVAYALKTQLNNGGWSGGASPAPLNVNEIDIAQTGWWTMALVSARLGGMNVPDDNLRRVRTVLMQVVDGNFPGKVLFTNHGGRESSFDKQSSINASIFTMLHFLGVPRDNPQIVRVSKQLANDLPAPNRRNYWMLYNMGLGMFQMGGQNPEWQQFSTNALRNVAQSAVSKGNGAHWNAPAGLFGGKNAAGRGDTGEKSGYWGDCGRTAMATLNLQVFYRYGDIHMLYEQFGGLISEQQLTGKLKPAADAGDDDDKPQTLLGTKQSGLKIK
jgi:hypothetical protein